MLVHNHPSNKLQPTLHEDLLYTSNRQSFEKAIQAFEFISNLFASIGE